MFCANWGMLLVAGGEIELCAGREVMDDFEHRGAFAAVASLAGQHRDRTEIAARLTRRETVDAVGQHANLDARAIDAVHQPREIREMRGVALAGDAALAGAPQVQAIRAHRSSLW